MFAVATNAINVSCLCTWTIKTKRLFKFLCHYLFPIILQWFLLSNIHKYYIGCLATEELNYYWHAIKCYEAIMMLNFFIVLKKTHSPTCINICVTQACYFIFFFSRCRIDILLFLSSCSLPENFELNLYPFHVLVQNSTSLTVFIYDTFWLRVLWTFPPGKKTNFLKIGSFFLT